MHEKLYPGHLKRGGTYAIISYDATIHIGGADHQVENERIVDPTILRTKQMLWRYNSIFNNGHPLHSTPRCYEAVHLGFDKEGNALFDAVRRLRMSPLDMDEVEAGTAPEFKDVERFVKGETESIEMTSGPAYTG